MPIDGPDVYTFTNTLTTTNGDGESKTTSTTKVLHPEDPNSAVGATKGRNLYFEGLITTERNNKDWESVGKFMNLDKGFYDYMVARNSKAADWREGIKYRSYGNAHAGFSSKQFGCMVRFSFWRCRSLEQCTAI